MNVKHGDASGHSIYGYQYAVTRPGWLIRIFISSGVRTAHWPRNTFKERKTAPRATGVNACRGQGTAAWGNSLPCPRRVAWLAWADGGEMRAGAPLAPAGGELFALGKTLPQRSTPGDKKNCWYFPAFEKSGTCRLPAHSAPCRANSNTVPTAGSSAIWVHPPEARACQHPRAKAPLPTKVSSRQGPAPPQMLLLHRCCTFLSVLSPLSQPLNARVLTAATQSLPSDQD